ncbi:hypothetical protein G5B88_20700 [Herbaspirillum seropedicae]|uniref:hypothetical protein n=1 Tax=Herbaspirillum seropedicae TaxID=964 RepID=UPI0012E0F192|nr:hypothetical protein [Herbaspirillum seropedicae]UMU23390.1 hypothetical protein G5B88_20700 [Herbaspirillum seropedicae]
MSLTISDIQAGDVLLCYSHMTAGEDTAGETGYSHAAIALRDGQVLEASNSGVKVVSAKRLLDDYDHIAVLREYDTSELWDETRLNSLHEFAAQNINKGFNQTGLMRYHSRKEGYQNDQMKRIREHFEGTAPAVASDRGVYFCSELVTAAFIHVGIILPSSAVVFTPETFSPSDVAKDKAFGFFCGYVKSTQSYVIPEGDFFKHHI